MTSFNPTITITLAPQTAALLERVAANLDTANQLLSENEKLLSSVIANELAVEVAPDLSPDPLPASPGTTRHAPGDVATCPYNYHGHCESGPQMNDFTIFAPTNVQAA